MKYLIKKPSSYGKLVSRRFSQSDPQSFADFSMTPRNNLRTSARKNHEK